MESIVKFIVSTPLGFTVRTTESYWKKLLVKHPDIANFEVCPPFRNCKHTSAHCYIRFFKFYNFLDFVKITLGK